MICAASGCDTVLSKYNSDAYCTLHQGDAIEPGYCLCGCGLKTKLTTRPNTRDGAVVGEPRLYVAGHHKARLSAASVRQIRKEYAAGGVTYRELAQRYGVSEYTVRDVVLGRTWGRLV